jgi:uncharacterized protein YneF (UPF0154 family)
MIPWYVLVILTLSHVAMFAGGVAAYQIMRWVNARPIYKKPEMSESKIQQMADRMLQKSAAEAARYAYLQGPPVPVGRVEGEESFAPTK